MYVVDELIGVVVDTPVKERGSLAPTVLFPTLT
jgi:hypothetical protein